MYTPTIGTKGVFTFEEPFNVPPYTDRILKVISIRSLEEVKKDGADPLNNIYIKAGLTQEDYNKDINDNVCLIVFKTKSESVLYVPANKIQGIPIIDGEPYVRKMITVNLGAWPCALDLSTLVKAIEETTMEFIGVKPATKVSDASEVTLVEKTRHKQFITTLNNTPYAKRNQPWSVKYKELQKQFDDLREQYAILSEFMAKTWANNVVSSDRPTTADLETYTKRCVIDFVAPKGAEKKAAINSLVFYKRDSFNMRPVPVYMKGMMETISNSNKYTALLDKTPARFQLDNGVLMSQLLPDIFSDASYVQFEKDPDTGISRGSISFEFDQRVNIRDLRIRPALTDNLHCSKIRVTLYNQEDTMIYCVSFQLGTHYAINSQQGLSQYLEIKDMQLSTNIPQTQPPELTP